MAILPVVPAHKLIALPQEKKWLIEGLWTREAVGIIGGEPKSCKSLLALSMAVAVTSAKPCLQTFDVKQKGRVLLYAAEDAAHIVRDRLEKICTAQSIDLKQLDLWVITAPTVHLDVETERLNLVDTVEKLKPTLLILDPFVRLHTGIDENLSSAVAPILSSLRRIQKRRHCAVIIVHHARKGAAHIRGGQALRGSSEFHAWGDSNLFLKRRKNTLLLDIEHRNQTGQTELPITLDVDENSLALKINRLMSHSI
jgi:RecA-family ATPase